MEIPRSRPLYGDSFSLFIRICKLKKECAAFSSPPWGFFFSIPLDVFGYYPPGTFSSPPRGFFFSMQPQTDFSTKRGWFSSPPRGFFFSIERYDRINLTVPSSRPLHGDSFSLCGESKRTDLTPQGSRPHYGDSFSLYITIQHKYIRSGVLLVPSTGILFLYGEK